MLKSCIVCHGENFDEIMNESFQPLARYGLSKSFYAADNAKKYPLRIVKCQSCGLVFNKLFHPESVDYGNSEVLESRVFSDGIRKHMDESTERIRERLKICSNDTILEIGCGEGYFLSRFQPNSNLYAFEPSPEGYIAEKIGLNIYHEYFDLNQEGLRIPKLVILRQVLEHLSEPGSMLTKIASLLRERASEAYLYLEVPNSRKTIDEKRFFDFYYEHVAYYTTATLARLIEEYGFFVLEIRESYSGEIIELLAMPKKERANTLEIKTKIEWVKKKIKNEIDAGKRIVGWGTAGNGSALLNFCGITTAQVEFVVDSDKRKQGAYMPGTGQLVIAPEKLIEINPDIILVMSQLHKMDIVRSIRGLLGEKTEILYFD